MVGRGFPSVLFEAGSRLSSFFKQANTLAAAGLAIPALAIGGLLATVPAYTLWHAASLAAALIAAAGAGAIAAWTRWRDKNQGPLWEQRFRQVTTLSAHWYWEMDGDLRFTMHTAWTSDKLGPNDSPIGGYPWSVAGLIPLAPGGWDGYRALLAARVPFSDLEFLFNSPAGDRYYYSVNGEPIFDAQDIFQGYRGIGRNITRRKQTRFLNAMERHVAALRLSDAPLHEVLSGLCRELNQAMPAAASVIHLASSNEERLALAAAPGLPQGLMDAELSVARGTGSWSDALLAGTHLELSDLSGDPLQLRAQQLDPALVFRSASIVPLASAGQLLGTLTIYWPTARTASRFERALLDRAARIGSEAIEQARHEDFRHLAMGIFQNAEHGIIITDHANDIVWVNQAFSDITGYASEEVVGRNPSILSPGPDGQSFYWGMWDTLTHTGRWHGTVRDTRKDGSIYYKNLSVVAIKDALGHITHHAGLFADITREKEAERRLRLRHRVTQILAGSEDAETILRSVCRAICQAFELDAGTFWTARENTYGLFCTSFWHRSDEHGEQFARALARFRLEPELEPIRAAWTRGSLLRLEEMVRMRRRPAHELAELGKTLFQPFMVGNELLGMLGFHPNRANFPMQNLVEIAHSIGTQVETFLIKRRTEAALRASETELRLITENLPAGIAYYDRNLFCGFANPAYAALFGLSVEQTVGRHIEAIVGRGDFRHEATHFRRALAGESVSYQRADKREGSTRFIEVTLVAAGPDDGVRFNGCYALCRDVTDQVRAEQEIRDLNAQLETRVRERTRQLEAVVKELEAFSYSISHDLRAPLRAIDGFARILDQKYADRLDDSGKNHLDRIRRGSQRMEELIDDMLMLSQVTRGEFERAEVDVGDIARTIIDGLTAAEPQRMVEVSIADDVIVSGDRRLIRIAMENLLGNAWKFSAKRQPAAIGVGIADTRGGKAVFVRDNGAGFDMRYAHKLFASFQRLHSASEFEGTGIGLAIVQRIVNRHGGKIWAEAKPGQGAVFYMQLSCVDSTAPPLSRMAAA